MKKKIKKTDLFSKVISFEDNLILPIIFGRHDENLKKIEEAFEVSILPRGNYLKIDGKEHSVEITVTVLNKLYQGALKDNLIETGDIEAIINIFKNNEAKKPIKEYEVIESINIVAGKKL